MSATCLKCIAIVIITVAIASYMYKCLNLFEYNNNNKLATAILKLLTTQQQ